MAHPGTDIEILLRTLRALKEAGSQRAGAKLLDIPRTTFRAYLARAHQLGLRITDDNAAIGSDQTAPDAVTGPTLRVRVRQDHAEEWDVIAIGDFHSSPRITDDRALWIGRCARDILSRSTCRKALVQIGDFCSMDSLSAHPADGFGTIAGQEKPSFKEDMSAWGRDLDLMDEGLDDVDLDEKHVTMGNHDCYQHGRPGKWENLHPEAQGMIGFEIQRFLEKHGWTHSPYGHHWFLGGVAFTHVPLSIVGREIGSGELPAAQISLKAVYDICYGHTHKSEDVRRPKIGPAQFVRVINLGCAMPNQHLEHYVNKGSMSGWWWGIHHLKINQGHIHSSKQISMLELEDLYG